MRTRHNRLSPRSKDPPPPHESGQTESNDFNTPTKKSLRRNLKVLSPEKAIPPETDLGASSSKDRPPPLEFGQTVSDDFTTPTKISRRRNFNGISPVKGIPPNTELCASSSKDLRSGSDSESDDSGDDSAVKKCRSERERNRTLRAPCPAAPIQRIKAHVRKCALSLKCGFMLVFLSFTASFGSCALSLSVNSIGHINHPVCWAIIPESESKEIIPGTWRSVQAAAMMIMKKIKLCNDDECAQCGACSCIRDLLAMPLVVQFMNQLSFKEDKFDVDATLSDCCK